MRRLHVTAWLAALVVAGAGIVSAFGQQDQVGWAGQARFGLVGLARGQTARLSVVAVGGGQGDPGNACVVSLKFLDAGGKPLVGQNGAPVETQPTLLVPDQAVVLDFRAPVSPGQSTLIQADLALACPFEYGRDDVAATLEIFDTLSGRTQVLYPDNPEISPKNPALFPKDPEVLRLGMMGLARGQAARLSVLPADDNAQFPPNPCMATLGFVDATGQPLNDANGLPISAEFELVPGQTAQLYLRGPDAFRDSQAMRREIRARVGLSGIIEPDLSCPNPIVTVEIIDVLTGRTQALRIVHPEL